MTDIILEIQETTSFEALSAKCYRYFAQRGVCQFSYFHFPPIGAVDYTNLKLIVWMGYPNAWVEAYQNAGYVKNDPVVVRLLREHKPVWTQECLALPNASPAELAYLELLRSCGVKDDLAIPVFGPGGRDGGYGIGFEDDAHDISQAQINEIQWVCQCAHIKYCELLDLKLEKAPDLSAREAEVLKLIANGASSPQIAETLSVSPKTIETYLSRIFAKLDVHDRMTAALRAISNGMI